MSEIVRDGRTISGEPRIQAVGRASGLLEALLAAPHGTLPLRDLARLCGLAKTTAFTLADSLVDVGLLEQDGRGTYRLGKRLIAFGRAAERRLDVVGHARPAMIRLCAATRETVNLALPRPLDAFIVESLEGSQALRVTSYAGTAASYHATACGRALLAFQPAPMRDAVLRRGPLARQTPHTEHDPDRLEATLAACRADGWTLECEQSEPGAACLAAPIHAFGAVQAAISIAAPIGRMDAATVVRVGAVLTQETAAIGRALEARARAA